MPVIKNKRVFFDRNICAKVIEEFVNDPDQDYKESCVRNKITYNQYNYYIGKWFSKIQNENTEVITLQSKI